MEKADLKVLIVDDSSVMRSVLTDILKRIGFSETNITGATNGQEAVDIVVKSQFDIILLDWNMPEKDGFTALKEIRASGNKTPIMMVTTEGERLRVIEAIKAGANNYLVKPFDATDLEDKVQQLLASVS